MSVYDSIRCEYPLPDSALQDEEFQTKDLGEGLRRYTITRDGRLLRHLPNPDRVASVDRPAEFNGSSGTEPIPHHGDLRIYTTATKGELAEYRVRFTHGLVEWIRPEPGTIAPDDTASLATLAEIPEALERDREAAEAAILMRLERLDPEVAAQAIYVFDDRADAAHWLTRPHPELDDVTPLRALAEGRRREVLDLLGRIFHGIPV